MILFIVSFLFETTGKRKSSLSRRSGFFAKPFFPCLLLRCLLILVKNLFPIFYIFSQYFFQGFGFLCKAIFPLLISPLLFFLIFLRIFFPIFVLDFFSGFGFLCKAISSLLTPLLFFFFFF